DRPVAGRGFSWPFGLRVPRPQGEEKTMSEPQRPVPVIPSGPTWVDEMPWEAFDPSRVDPALVRTVKAAAMVEFNAYDYAAYLTDVCPDDPEFKAAAENGADEEVRHGVALGRWAKMADPT